MTAPISVTCQTCGDVRLVSPKNIARASVNCRACNIAARHVEVPGQPHKGSLTCYGKGCRRPECRAEKNAAVRRYRAKLADAPTRVVLPRKPERDLSGGSAPSLKVSAYREKSEPATYVPAAELCCVETDTGMCERPYPCRVHKDSA